MIFPEFWQPANGMILEPNAFSAATEQTHCLAITAVPGAGKTEMLAQRADFLLQTGICFYPRRILAIAFKVDAARYLRERVKQRLGVDLAERFDSYTFHAFANQIVTRFREFLTGDDALDYDYTVDKKQRIPHRQIRYDDMVPLAIKILQNLPSALYAIRHTYSDVFLDEFQDCTAAQYQLIRLAFFGAGIRLTAVGDPKQKIMGWAGALDGIFLIFATDFYARELRLYINHRSMPRLLQLQNQIIARLDPQDMMPANLITGTAGVVNAWSFQTEYDEAAYLAQQIGNWINNEGIQPSEIAILISKNPELYAKPLMKELERLGIPYRNEAGEQDLSAEPLARLIIDYLLVLYGEYEPIAFPRLMATLIPFGEQSEEEAAHRDWYQFINGQIDALRVGRAFGSEMDWNYYVDTMLAKIGRERVISLSASYQTVSFLDEILTQIKKWITEQLRAEPNLVKAIARFSEDSAVRILTIHKSKGLEFDSVIILAVEDETFWGNNAEERRAFFVAVSRAKRRLVMTCCNQRNTPENPPGWWKVQRHCHQEFYGYFQPFVSATL